MSIGWIPNKVLLAFRTLFLPALVVVGVRVGFTGGGLGVVQTLATLSRLIFTSIAVSITLTFPLA